MTQTEGKPPPSQSLQNMPSAATVAIKQQAFVTNPILPSKFPKESLESLSTPSPPSTGLAKNVQMGNISGTNQSSVVFGGSPFHPSTQPPKRTVFSPTSSIGSPPDYSQNIAEMMQAVRNQANQQTTKEMTSLSSVGLSQKANGKSTSVGLTEKKQAIMQKFNETNQKN